MQTRSRYRRQQGAALITALLVVSLAAVLVSGLLWRQQVEIRRVDNQRESLQSRWVSRGAFDWTRLILRTEADSTPATYLGGVWSVPIAPTRLSTFLGQLGEARAAEGASIWLSGNIDDAQGKFNLRNLVTNNSGTLSVDPLALAQFQKLLSVLGLGGEMASPIATRMRLSLQESVTRGQKADTGNLASMVAGAAAATTTPSTDTASPGIAEQGQQNRFLPIQMHTIDALRDVPGVTTAFVTRLRPFVTVLPVPTPINLNTAGPEVIAASIPALALPAAQGFVHSRDQAFFVNLGDAQTRMQRFAPNSPTLDAARFDITTHFFTIPGEVRQERAVVDRTALIYRDPRTHSTHIIQVNDVLAD